MKLCFSLVATLLLIPILSFARVENHTRIGLEMEIPDLGFVSYPASDFAINQIDTIELKVKIEHERAGDLLVTFTGPDSTYVVLHNMKRNAKHTLVLQASGGDLLGPFIGKSAVGTWQLQIYDQLRGKVGTLEDFSLIINGKEIDFSIDRPIPKITASECSAKWQEILDQVNYDSPYKSLINNCGEDLKYKLRAIISNNRDLGYTTARRIMFSSLDNVNGRVCSVYSDRCLSTKGIPSSSVMNCEHSWPQSKGATGIAKSDLHHLYPAMSKENSTRSNHPFCESSAGKSTSVGTLVNGSCYMPPVSHRGDLARSMFYFSIRYNKAIDRKQEAFFRKWNREDRISTKESKRNDGIENRQGNRNPFVDHPELVDLINNF